MAKGRATPSLPDAESTSSSSVIETKGLSAKHVSMVTNFLRSVGAGVSDSIPDNCNTKEFYSDIIRDTIKPDLLLRGRVTCLLTVKPTVAVTLLSFLSFFFLFTCSQYISFFFFSKNSTFSLKKKKGGNFMSPSPEKKKKEGLNFINLLVITDLLT